MSGAASVQRYTAPAGGWDDDAFRSWGGCNRAGWWNFRPDNLAVRHRRRQGAAAGAPQQPVEQAVAGVEQYDET